MTDISSQNSPKDEYGNLNEGNTSLVSGVVKPDKISGAVKAQVANTIENSSMSLNEAAVVRFGFGDYLYRDPAQDYKTLIK